MAAETVPVTVKILDKEIRVACNEGEQDALIASAQLLDNKMREVRESGKVIGQERVVIMAALNLTHELLQQRNSFNEQEKIFAERVESMQSRIENSLQNLQQMEF